MLGRFLVDIFMTGVLGRIDALPGLLVDPVVADDPVFVGVLLDSRVAWPTPV